MLQRKRSNEFDRNDPYNRFQNIIQLLRGDGALKTKEVGEIVGENN
ncbi:hypothetical protein LCGC14_1801900, partial [marine sediment metagenome]